MIAASLTGAPASLASVPAAHLTSAQAERAVRVIPQPRLRARSPIPPPTPTPAPKPAIKPRTRYAAIPAGPVDKNSVAGIIIAAANRWGVSSSWMLSIARCESGLNPHSYNPHGPYYGLFQFLMSTFTHNGGRSIWDPTDQANIAAKMLAHGQAYQWSCA